jgi:hypothetical protein
VNSGQKRVYSNILTANKDIKEAAKTAVEIQKCSNLCKLTIQTETTIMLSKSHWSIVKVKRKGL